MGDRSGIEWTDATWNPVRGCSRVSEGCRHCYAERMAARLAGPGRPYDGLVKTTSVGVRWTGEIRTVPEILDQPLRWRRPRRIFVNSMSDLFHPDVPDDFVDQVFGVMLACEVLVPRRGHAFQILTKRPERMRDYFASGGSALVKRWALAVDYVVHLDDPDIFFSEYVRGLTSHGWSENGTAPRDEEPEPWGHLTGVFPLPNVWLGVSVENQAAADERIPLLLQTPAAVKWISAEPLLGPVRFEKVPGFNRYDALTGAKWWVVAGGESGPGARPMHPDWARSLRDQCASAGVPFLFKQWGAWLPTGQGGLTSVVFDATVLARDGSRRPRILDGTPRREGETVAYRASKHNNGRHLDGKLHDGYPEAAR